MADERFKCPDCGWPEDDCDCNGPSNPDWCYDKGEWECQFPGKCLMADPLHHRSECYTVEDAEEWAKEQEA